MSKYQTTIQVKPRFQSFEEYLSYDDGTNKLYELFNIETELQPGELITAVDLPSIDWANKSYYLKVRDRNSYAFALVSVVAALDIQDNTIQQARVAMGGVAHKPWRAMTAEEMLVGKPASEETFRQAAETALFGAQTYEHNAFKVELGKRAIVRALSTVAASV